jgi:hypothetical protein
VVVVQPEVDSLLPGGLELVSLMTIALAQMPVKCPLATNSLPGSQRNYSLSDIPYVRVIVVSHERIFSATAMMPTGFVADTTRTRRGEAGFLTDRESTCPLRLLILRDGFFGVLVIEAPIDLL